MNSSLKGLLLAAPDSQLDPALKPLIEKWDEQYPTPLQVLEVLDAVIHGGQASSFVVSVLQIAYDSALQTHKTAHEIVVLQATWRK